MTASDSQTTPAVLVRGVDVAVLARLLQQTKREGKAVVGLVDAAAAPRPPARGAAEPGKGRLVDVLA